MTVKNLLKKLDTEYIPKFFNGSLISDFLKNNEKKVIIVLRIDENEKPYNTFDGEFSAYLSKLPNSPLKKSVGFVFNKKLIFYGTAKNTDGITYARVLISKNDKLAGIVLNSYALDISIREGSTPSIDDVIYASYYGLIRAAAIIHKQEIRRDKELLKNIAMCMSTLVLKTLGRNIAITQKEKKLLVQLICIYLFYRQFLEEKHTKIISIIHKNYSDLFSKEDLEGLSSYIDKLNSFNNFKDLPRIIQLFGVADINPAQITMLLIRAVGANGFHVLIGSLDNLVASLILTRYPTEIISRGFSVNSELQEKIEQSITGYINKISYEEAFNSLAQKSAKE